MNNKIYFWVLLNTLFFLSSCQMEELKKEIKTETIETFILSDKMLATTKLDTASLKPVKNILKLYGKITTDNNKMIEVYPIVGGNVTKVYVELGDYVKKGQVLATIRSTEVAGFEQDLDDAKNDLIVAKNNLKVTQELFEGKLITEREVIEAQNGLDRANSQLHRIEETYKIYNIKKGSVYEVRSPISGFVTQKNINQDMLLRSDKSDNIFDIAEISDVWAIVNVNESDISEIKLGIDAEIVTLSYPDKRFYGKIDKIYNIIDEETKAMKARVKLKNTDFLLKPEMRATIKLSYTEEKEMIAVPSVAVVFDRNKRFVMVFKSRNNIDTREVEVFREIDGITYISSGLDEGEKILITNQLLVYDALND